MIALGTRDHHARVLAVAMVAASLPASGVLGDVYIPAGVHDVDLLPNGNLFITDGGRGWDPNAGGVFEIERDGNIVWSLAEGLNFAHNADQQPDRSAIISDTGNDRVIIVDLDGTIVWNTDDVVLSDGSVLDYPNDANLLPSGNRLITDRNNHRVIEIEALGTIVWQFGETGVPGDGPTHLFGPHNADRLANGNTIICDSNNNRIIEVNPAGVIVWGYAGSLDWPRDADRLSNGHTLINDSNNHRIVEVTFAGTIVWEYPVEGLSYDADRIPSGNTLISVDDRIIEVQPDGEIVWSYPPDQTDEVWVLNPTSGIELYCHIHRPVGFDSETTYPGVVLVPGGSGAGTSFDDGGLAQDYANHGFIVMHFDPDGRGESTAGGTYTEEDYDGFLHQDGLHAVLQRLVGLPETDDCQIGVLSAQGACSGR
jgi:outer membrane protein assembly factor BamB